VRLNWPRFSRSSQVCRNSLDRHNNWSDYTNFDTGSVSHNHDIFVLGDQQLNQLDRQLPFRGWYAANGERRDR
jgi:hypothetical protein